MRHRLATAALIAFLGSTADVRPLVAQFARPPSSAAAALRYARVPLDDKGERAKTAIRGARKHHVIRPLPNQRKIAERKGYKRVSDLVNFPKFFPGLGIILVMSEYLLVGTLLFFYCIAGSLVYNLLHLVN